MLPRDAEENICKSEKKGFDADPNQAKITASLFGERTADEVSRPCNRSSREPPSWRLGMGFETTVPTKKVLEVRSTVGVPNTSQSTKPATGPQLEPKFSVFWN